MQDFPTDNEKVSERAQKAPGETIVRKVGIFVDIPNIETCSIAKNDRIEFGKIMEEAKRYGKIKCARAYAILRNNSPPSGAITRSYRAGFQLVPIVAHGDSIKDIDTQMTADIVSYAFETDLDVFVIATGDADFVPAVSILKRLGKKSVVIGIDGYISKLLSLNADGTLTIADFAESEGRKTMPNGGSFQSAKTINNPILEIIADDN